MHCSVFRLRLYFITSSPVQNYYEIYEKRSQRFTHVHNLMFQSSIHLTFLTQTQSTVHTAVQNDGKWERDVWRVTVTEGFCLRVSEGREHLAPSVAVAPITLDWVAFNLGSPALLCVPASQLSALPAPSSPRSSVAIHVRTYVRLTQIWSSDYAYCNAKLLAARIGRRKNQSLRSGGLARILPRLRGSHRRRSVLSRRAPLSGTLCERRSRRWRF